MFAALSRALDTEAILFSTSAPSIANLSQVTLSYWSAEIAAGVTLEGLVAQLTIKEEATKRVMGFF